MEKIKYRNVFAELGKSQEEIDLFLNNIFYSIFYGDEKFFFLSDDERMGFLVDTGNNDTRTEGISYGMMMCVQMNHQKEFNQLWTWAKEKMFLEQGPNKGYFAWSVSTKGEKNDFGPAPDGEEFFAMSLFFASHRWGDGEGIFNYSAQARRLLKTCIHHKELYGGDDMWDRQNHLIKFIPGVDFTDPSYHLPHFYQLFSEWADEEDRKFWEDAAKASREYLRHACNLNTGLSPEYSLYDGSPYEPREPFGRHDWFYSDAYRTIANIALDYEWCSKNTEYGKWETEICEKLQRFFCQTVGDNSHGIYDVAGNILEGEALHPIALAATNAQSALATNSDNGRKLAEEFFNLPPRTGDRRYYDNCLYMFAALALSGNYRIW